MASMNLNRPGSAWSLREIRATDREAVCAVIRDVMTSMNLNRPGFALSDAEVQDMPAAYRRAGHWYGVLVDELGEVVGGAGIAPLEGGEPGVCELRKMYFRPKARGQGWGRRLLEVCLEKAGGLGYKQIYLETLTGMDAAIGLYKKLGFKPIGEALGATGHFSCDKFFVLELETE